MLRDAGHVHRIYARWLVRGRERLGNVGAYARYMDLTTGTTSFSETAAYNEDDIAVGTGAAAREMRVAWVSASFFGFFNAPPARGRYFSASEDQPPAGVPVVVLSHAAWKAQFGEGRDPIGAKVQIGRFFYTIIGVAPPEFAGLWPSNPPAFFLPITTAGASQSTFIPLRSPWWKTYQWDWLGMIARRKPGVSLDVANADLNRAMLASYAHLQQENPRAAPVTAAKPNAFASSILTERGPTGSSAGKVFTWVSGVAIVVLLVACANVSNLMLAHALRRRKETAVLLAMGASRFRLLFKIIVENLLLASMGGVVALVIAQWGNAFLRARFLPGTQGTAVLEDQRTVAFAAAVVVGVGLLTSLIPAVTANRASLTADLKSGTRGAGLQRSRLRGALLVAQAALSVVLLVAAGLFVRSLVQVQALRLGYDADPVAVVGYNPRGIRLTNAQMWDLRSRMLEHAKRLPGVEQASLMSVVPFRNFRSTRLFVDGIDSVDKLGRFDYNAVSSSYFATMGTRIIRGRAFDDAKGPSDPRMMVVSEAMAQALWPGRDALGQCVRLDADTMPCTTVVGIAENIKSAAVSGESGLYYYIPAAHSLDPRGGLFVRTRARASEFTEVLRRELQREMPGDAYVTVWAFSDDVGRQLWSWRIGATMFLAFGALALVIAAVGLYSVVAYGVAQRTHELGVRRAIGAQSGDIVRLFIHDALRLAGIGIALGAAIALVAGRWIQPLLFNESARDPIVFVVVAALLVAVSLAASWIPARRAASVDPVIALRID
jgi:predicted permease